MIGLRLDGRYEIIDRLGIGGMSDVYIGRDIMENRSVAVKILKAEFSSNAEFVRCFRNESKAIAVLSHPNIVKIFDVGHEKDLEFIVMERIEGITLKEYIDQVGIVPWRECVHYTIQILRALQLAHDRGIIHRDIKPQNIMKLSDGTIKVMDFGIANFSRQTPQNTGEKTMGSVHYVSPEQARGERTDERSDIYSVGVIMYEMLTGRKPFDGETPVSVALKHMNEEPVRPSEYVSTMYKGLEEIILRAMEKDPDQRYQSATGMIGDIEAFKQDQSIVFGYTSEPVSRPRSKKKLPFAFPAGRRRKTAAQEYVEEDIPSQEEYDDDEDYEIEEPRHNYILPILTATTVTVMIVAVLFVAHVVLPLLKTAPSSSNDYTMPSLIGLNFYDARAQYPDIQLVASEEYNSEYPSGVIIEQGKAEGRIVKKGSAITVIVSKGTRSVTVPDVVNYHFNSASDALDGENLKYLRIETESDDIAAEYVVRTDPEAYTSVEEGSTVKVYVSIGPSTEDTAVPDVKGRTVSEAEDMLKAAYLVPKVQYIESSEPLDTVVSQNIIEGEVVTRNTVVTIYVSDGNGTVSDPFDDTGDIDLPENLEQGGVLPGGQTQGYVVVRVDIPASASNTYSIVLENTQNGEAMSESVFFSASNYAGSYIEIPVYGSGSVELSARLKSPRTGMYTQLAQYDVNFEDGSWVCKNYSSFAFALIDVNGLF